RLRAKGVDADTARDALEALDPVLEEDQARDLVARRLRSMAGLDAVVQTRRLAGMLARKGYGPELSMRVIREALAEAPEHQRD
ncbi:MAG: RecX family transcriptional regulator, partial [Tetrasphaera sp.]|nr:RecX family transcriptional regulator [Tetrasphaera sp.]